jgi:hypothetical protein
LPGLSQDALAYINFIRPEAEQYGICKIIPPDGWSPPFCLDKDKFKYGCTVPILYLMQPDWTAGMSLLGVVLPCRVPNHDGKSVPKASFLFFPPYNFATMALWPRRFHTRIQHLNQLEARCRVRHNFYDKLRQFHKLHGVVFVPNIHPSLSSSS